MLKLKLFALMAVPLGKKKIRFNFSRKASNNKYQIPPTNFGEKKIFATTQLQPTTMFVAPTKKMSGFWFICNFLTKPVPRTRFLQIGKLSVVLNSKSAFFPRKYVRGNNFRYATASIAIHLTEWTIPLYLMVSTAPFFPLSI